MNRPAFRDFRLRVADYAQSIGSPLGVCVNNIPALAGLVNAATERLLSDPLQPEEGWWGTWAKFVFNINRSQPYITCPRGVARVIVTDVCKHPVRVENSFYEFLDFGAGLQTGHDHHGDSWEGRPGELLQVYDRGAVPTLGGLVPPAQIIAFFPTDARDVGKSVIVQGNDQNGNVVYGTDPVTNRQTLGETVKLAMPFSLSANQYSSISGLQKDITYGPLTIKQQDPVSSNQQNLSAMEPSETAAAYRTYLVAGLPCHGCKDGQAQVTAQCKLDYVPVASDPDWLVIPNVPALIAEAECLRFESMDNQKAQAMAVVKHQKALSLLFGQLDSMLGKQRPAISVPIFGSAPLRHQPI